MFVFNTDEKDIKKITMLCKHKKDIIYPHTRMDNVPFYSFDL